LSFSVTCSCSATPHQGLVSRLSVQCVSRPRTSRNKRTLLGVSMALHNPLKDFHDASREFSTLLHDVNKHGEPVTFCPPTWRCWQVEEWRCYHSALNYSSRWELAGTHWIASLSEFQTLHERLPRTDGSYQHRRLVVTAWLCSYTDPHWQQEECA
jgi:hypothetical protein